jgi:hypothetical protein
VNSKQAQDETRPGSEQVLEQQLALWVARHALSAAKMNAIRQAVLQQVEPTVNPLPREWWVSFIKSLRAASQVSLHLGSFSELCGIASTTARIG